MSSYSIFVATSTGVSVLNPDTRAQYAGITVSPRPYFIAISPDGTKAYAVNTSNGTISVISPATNTVVSAIAASGRAWGIAFSPDGTKACVSDYSSSTVTLINVAAGTLGTPISVGSNVGPRGLAFSADGSKVYICNHDFNSLSVLNVSAGTVTTPITGLSSPSAITLSPNGTQAYVAGTNSVSVISLSGPSVSSTIAVSGINQSVAFSPDGTKAYVAGSGGLSIINVSAGTNSGTVSGLTNCYGVSFSPDGTLAYASNPTAGTLSVITVSTDTIANTISGLTATEGIAIGPELGTPPGALNITGVSATTISVTGSGNAGDHNTSEEVQIAPDASGAPGIYTTFATGLSGGFSETFTGLTPYTLYWVREVGQGGPNGDQPGPGTQVRTATDIPAVTFGAVTTSSIVVNVPAYPADITAWDLYRTDQGGAIAVGIAPSAAYTDTNALSAGVTYFYHLQATENGVANVQGPLASQATASAPPPPAPGTPSAPTFGTPTTTTAPVIMPAFPANTTSLSLQRAPDIGGFPGSFTTIATGLGSGATFTDTGLTISTKYWYRAIAVGTGSSTTGPYAADMTSGPDTTPPTFSSGSVNSAGTAIAWVFADPTSTGLLPASPTGLSATADGVTVTLGTATVSGMIVTTPVTSSPIRSGQAVFGSYAPGTLTDNASTPNAVAAFTHVPITNNSAVTAPISVAITSPASGTGVQGLVDILVAASGGAMGISRVELYVEGSLVDTETVGSSGTYTCLWDTTAAGNGPYTVYAIAYDNATPANHAQSASITLNAANPDRLGTGYWFSALEPPVPAGTILSAVATADLVGTTDQRALRELLFGITTNLASFNFEQDYTVIALNEDFLLPSPSTQYRLAAKLQQRYSLGPFTFTGQVVKMIPFGSGAVVWTADGKLYAFDGISAPALLLDSATVLLAGETLRDVSGFGGRLYLALSGGSAPITSRLYAYDPAAGDESYTVVGFSGAASALTSVGTGASAALFIGTDSGLVHRLGADGTLKKVCGGSAAALPFGVASLLPVALTSNTSPGVTIILTDGSAWDIDGTAVYGATQIFSPPDGHSTAATIADQTYLASAGGGLYAAVDAVFGLAYTFPHGVTSLASYGATVYAGLSGDSRLWGKTLTPGAHALAYGPVTDPLGYVSGSTAGLTSITALIVIGTALYIGGTAGSGENTLWEYNAPDANALGVFGKSFKHPALEVRSFQ